MEAREEEKKGAASGADSVKAMSLSIAVLKAPIMPESSSSSRTFAEISGKTLPIREEKRPFSSRMRAPPIRSALKTGMQISSK